MGIKYQTFASWVQKRRHLRRQYPPATKATVLPSTSATAAALRLVEAVVEHAGDDAAIKAGGKSLCVYLPGGARVEVRGF